MSQVIFWDVDTQVDFMLPGKPLYVPGAETLLPNLADLTRYGRGERLPMLSSEDWHSLTDPEISDQPDWVTTYPAHCLAGTAGQRRVPETRPRNPLVLECQPLSRERLAELVRAHRGEIVFHKHAVDVFTNANVEPVLELLSPAAVVLYGVAQDVCLRCAVEGFLRLAAAELFLVSDATRAIDASRGDSLLEAWRRRGLHAVTTAEVLAGAVAAERVGAV